MLWSVFLTKLQTLGVLFSTAVRALVVTKLVILGISPLTSFILALRAALVAKLVMLGISPLTLFILALRVVLVAKLVISGILGFYFSIIYIFFNDIIFYYIAYFTYQHLIYLLYFSNCLN